MSKLVSIDYTNYRGERGLRLIEPGRIFFGCTEYHPEDQWLLVAWDQEKQAERTFAMKDIHEWSAVRPHGVAIPDDQTKAR